MRFQQVVQEHLLICNLLFDSILTIGKSKFVLNTHRFKIFFCLSNLFQFTLLGSQFLIKQVFFFIIFRSEFLFTLAFLIDVRRYICSINFQKRNLLFTICNRIIQHTPYILQLLVECYNFSPLFCYFQCLLTYWIIAVSRLTKPTVYLIIFSFEVCNQSPICL